MNRLSNSLSPKGRAALARLNAALSDVPGSDTLARAIAADLSGLTDAEAAGVLRRVRRELFEAATICNPDASETIINGLLTAFTDRVVGIRADMKRR
jgi:hypothetical protein